MTAICDFPVYLLRHGETEWNAEGRLQGHLDSPLTAKGRAQAAAQGALLMPILAHAPQMPIFTSPLGRAADTARIALAELGRSAQQLDALKEISAGSWDGVTLAQIARSNAPLYDEARNAFELMFLSPDGEAEEAVLARARGVISALSAPTVFFTHGAFLCVLRGLLRGMDFEHMLSLSHEQGCIYHLENGVETILR